MDKEFVQVMLRDPQHGAGNKKVIEGWLAKWLPYVREAIDAFAPLFDRATVNRIRSRKRENELRGSIRRS